MQDTAEAIDYQRQIEEALAGKLTEEDEEDVLAELEELEKSVLFSSIFLINYNTGTRRKSSFRSQRRASKHR